MLNKIKVLFLANLLTSPVSIANNSFGQNIVGGELTSNISLQLVGIPCAIDSQRIINFRTVDLDSFDTIYRNIKIPINCSINPDGLFVTLLPLQEYTEQGIIHSTLEGIGFQFYWAEDSDIGSPNELLSFNQSYSIVQAGNLNNTSFGLNLLVKPKILSSHINKPIFSGAAQTTLIIKMGYN